MMNMHDTVRDAKIKPSSIRIEIEAFTEGTDRRAHARAWVRETAAGVFEVIPFYLREISGPNVRWYSPARGMPILTGRPITGLDEAQNVFNLWAMQTFAENASPFPTGMPKYHDGDCRPDDPHTLLERMPR
jgi:hypothetical protein